MTRLERTTQFYWQLAQLARHDTFLDLVVRGLDGLAVVARTAPSHRLRRAAAAHVGVAARAHRFLNADRLEQAAVALTAAPSWPIPCRPAPPFARKAGCPKG
ncbi:hypothetical protein [Nitrospirillum amazonense]|uniref:Uncharacterized protein n=1 Tax=Nitrospirillum amazonense TaxID=28077 RepID=A0A560JFM2_9PROT|nr:hypothetical protein [Nitrospirillum amazonense]MDG3439375.1 hypothetical protein [Nitrospirillum amazonense]TWB69836.1 hypothetical protein FBZ87_108126 [Nitrospirillum amazonense]